MKREEISIEITREFDMEISVAVEMLSQHPNEKRAALEKGGFIVEEGSAEAEELKRDGALTLLKKIETPEKNYLVFV
jgi:hypothetical protein